GGMRHRECRERASEHLARKKQERNCGRAIAQIARYVNRILKPAHRRKLELQDEKWSSDIPPDHNEL
ncbi:MAG: hypothetical protein SNJ81_05085, partial [Cyanobacteriota bacterium]